MMVQLGRSDRFMGETCWTWGGANYCLGDIGGTWGRGIFHYPCDDLPVKVKKVIKRVAKNTKKVKEDEKAEVKFEAELVKLHIPPKPEYVNYFNKYRDEIMRNSAKRRQIEDDELACMLLL